MADQTADFGTYTVPRGDEWPGFDVWVELNEDGSQTELSTYGSVWTSEARTSPSATETITITVDQTNYDGSVDSSPTAPRLHVGPLDGTTTATMQSRSYVCRLHVTGGGISPMRYGKFILEVED